MSIKLQLWLILEQKFLGTQNATLENILDFKNEIADARTFSFLHEIEMLLENDLIKGGDLNKRNCLCR